jgi:hypothetical protein
MDRLLEPLMDRDRLDREPRIRSLDAFAHGWFRCGMMDQRHFFLSRAVTAPRSLEDPNEELHLVNAEPVIPEDSLRSRPRLPHHPAQSRGLDSSTQTKQDARDHRTTLATSDVAPSRCMASPLGNEGMT